MDNISKLIDIARYLDIDNIFDIYDINNDYQVIIKETGEKAGKDDVNFIINEILNYLEANDNIEEYSEEDEDINIYNNVFREEEHNRDENGRFTDKEGKNGGSCGDSGEKGKEDDNYYKELSKYIREKYGLFADINKMDEEDKNKYYKLRDYQNNITKKKIEESKEKEQKEEQEKIKREEKKKKQIEELSKKAEIELNGKPKNFSSCIKKELLENKGTFSALEKVDKNIQNSFNKIKLNKEEKEAIDYYTDNNFKEINKYLRAGGNINKKTEKNINTLFNLINKSELKEDVKVYRYESINENRLKEFKIGEEKIFESFTSTSFSEGLEESFGGEENSFKMTITVKKGKGKGFYLDGNSKVPDEIEFLMQKGLTFKIKKIDYNNKTMELEV